MEQFQTKRTLAAVLTISVMISVGVSAVAEAQTRSARGVDMRSLQHLETNPCQRAGKLHAPIHPNSDAQGCIAIVSKAPSSNILSIDASTTFVEESTFNEGIVLGQSLTCNGENEGGLRYDSSIKKVQFCDGSKWISIE